MKTCRTSLIAAFAASTMLVVPALAQQEGGTMRPLGPDERMSESIDPNSGATIRIITRQMAPAAQQGTEAEDPDVSGPEPDEGSDDTATDDAGTDDSDMAADDMDGADMPGGMDMDTFARDLFEHGYRQGYVAALTEMRMRAMREMRRDGMRGEDMRGDRRRGDRPVMRSDRRMQSDPDERGERGMRGERDRDDDRRGDRRRGDRVQIVEDAEGNTIVMLPPGMTPQMFLRQLEQRGD